MAPTWSDVAGLLGDEAVARNVLVILGVVALIVLLFVSGGSGNDTRRKAARTASGVIVVFLLAVLADHVTTYFAAIFVAAILFAASEYLENLAALILDRKWIVDMRHATPTEMKRKNQEEANLLAESKHEDPASAGTALEAIREFEKEVLDRLEATDWVLGVRRELRLMSPDGRRYIVDAVAHAADVDFVVEVLYRPPPRILGSKVQQLQDAIQVYQTTLRANGDLRSVRGLLVLSKDVPFIDAPEDIVIERFDSEGGTFVGDMPSVRALLTRA